jgi:YolD-like protein
VFVYNDNEVIQMVNDRGSIKWTSLMLPEHVELLKRIWSEDKKEVKPMLDEQELEMINRRTLEAYQNNEQICIQYYENGKTYEAQGIVTKLDQLNQVVVLQTRNNEKNYIPFASICHII